jgi:hypothetical protein
MAGSLRIADPAGRISGVSVAYANRTLGLSKYDLVINLKTVKALLGDA